MQFTKQLNLLWYVNTGKFVKAPADIRLFVAKTAAHLGIHKKVEVWLTEKVDVPCISGYLKPIILLPFTVLNNLDSSQAEAVIIHELAHIKRNDYIFNLIQSFVELTLFFNPFALLLGKAARLERENCCDDWVINYQFNRHEYARALLMLEKDRQFPVNLSLAATNGKKQLLIRIKRLFTAQPVTEMNIWNRLRLMGITCVAFGVLLLTTLSETRIVISEKHTATVIPAVKMLNRATVAATLNNEEVKSVRIVNAPNESMVATKSKATQQPANDKSSQHLEYADALINEELLGKNRSENTPVLVADKEEIPAVEYLVKIEEETSGSGNKRSYLLEYKKVNGQYEVKPLVIINKKKVVATKAKNATTKSSIKKQITS